MSLAPCGSELGKSLTNMRNLGPQQRSVKATVVQEASWQVLRRAFRSAHLTICSETPLGCHDDPLRKFQRTDGVSRRHHARSIGTSPSSELGASRRLLPALGSLAGCFNLVARPSQADASRHYVQSCLDGKDTLGHRDHPLGYLCPPGN
jgi:hypothetical protein